VKDSWHFRTEFVRVRNGVQTRWRWTCIDGPQRRQSEAVFRTYIDCLADALQNGMKTDSPSTIHTALTARTQLDPRHW
jgi:hypothetical protein